MPIDPAGTSPEPVAHEDMTEKLNLKCRRPGCDSITAEEVKIPGNNTATGRHMYRCTKCSATWNTNIGGSFDF